MKLMRFNESKTKLLAYRKTITTIKEILLEFEDRGFKPKIYQNGGNEQLTVIIESDSMNSFTKDLTINIVELSKEQLREKKLKDLGI